MTGRLVCVSNRIFLPRKSVAPGGLSVGILSALKRTGGMWFGWGGELTDHEPADPEIVIRDGVTNVAIELRSEEFQRYYNGFSNDALWPLFHYMPTKFRFRPEEREAYETVNRQFARQLNPLLKPTDLIWVHDYHLIPLACRLRELGTRMPLGFFLHIPFPYIETLRVLPNYAELVRDMLSYDVVGFQTEGDLRSFLSAVGHIFGTRCIAEDRSVRMGPRTIRCEVFPIGVDVDAIQADAIDASNGPVVRKMVDGLLGRKLVIGVDRLDYSKGLVERFADTDWTPIRYLNRNFPHASLMGFLRAAHVGLVTPLRDGMNLVAKEYLAAQDPEDPGVLVLSNLAGAACELTAAVQVNPHDAAAVGRAIQTALGMSLSERRERHVQLLRTLREHGIAAWTDRFLSALRSVPQQAVARAVS